MKTNYYIKSLLVLFILAGSVISGHATKWNVNVANFAFTPSNLPNVNVGDTIHWKWVSGSHTTTSTSIPSGAATWDHPINSSNQVFEYKVTVAGVYDYKCTPHASMGMTGTFTASDAAPTLNISPSNQNVSASAGSTSFSVVSNSSWTATSNATWCSVTPSGSGNGTISADYNENTTVNTRIANVTVTVSGIPSQTVTVTQAGAAPTLLVTPSNQVVSYTSGSTSFNVTSNTNWSTAKDASWCTVTSSGSGNGTISVDYTENTTHSIRTADITVSVTGLPPQVVTVTQDASTVSVAEKGNYDLRIYPNPSSGIFRVETINSSENITGYTVLDVTGKTILTQQAGDQSQVNIDLSSQHEGCYFLKVQTNQGDMLRKLLINR